MELPLWLTRMSMRLELRFWRLFRMRSMPRPPEDWRPPEKPESSATRSSSSAPVGDEREEGDVIPKNWLVERISVQQAETDNSRNGVPFGGQNDRWEKLKAALEPGDKIWTFSSPLESWEHLAGREGVAIVRKDRVVMSLVTFMN